MSMPRAFDWKRFASVIESGRKIALFLDYDGTLVPIRKDPDACILPCRKKKLLQKLSASDKCYIVIISGRSLSNIKKMAGVRGISYGGNHGFDMAGPGFRFTHKAALNARPVLLEVKQLLNKKIRLIKGVFVEDKKFSLSLHYRSVSEKALPAILRCFDEVTAPFVNKKKLKVIKGKMVLELVPNAEWNKGLAALWMLERLDGDFFPIYIGDDTTDETAFKALRDKGITIKAGISKKTYAHYHIEKLCDVERLLDNILKLL